MQTVKIHSKKDNNWIDATGNAVPLKYVSKTDISKEVHAGRVLKTALACEKALTELFSIINAATNDIKLMIKQEYELKKDKPHRAGKGSLTWYNFDRSLKVEADMNEIVKWDNALMTEALNLLNKYLQKNLSDGNTLIYDLVQSAFANTKGMIDTGKVFQILKHKDKIKANDFQKACELITQAQGIDRTKLYYRVWVKEEDGQYRNINLNFSNI